MYFSRLDCSFKPEEKATLPAKVIIIDDRIEDLELCVVWCFLGPGNAWIINDN